MTLPSINKFSRTKDRTNEARYRLRHLEERRAQSRRFYHEHKEARALYNKEWREKHAVERSAYDKEYSRTHKTEKAASRKEHHVIHKEELNEKSRAYHHSHSKEIRERRQQYRLDDPAKLNERQRLWAQKNPEKTRAQQQRRRALRNGAPQSDLTASQWKTIKEHYRHRCVYCGRKMKRLTQDHIIPLSKGGSHAFTNVVPACQSCNSRKWTGPPLIPVQPLLLMPLGA